MREIKCVDALCLKLQLFGSSMRCVHIVCMWDPNHNLIATLVSSLFATFLLRRFCCDVFSLLLCDVFAATFPVCYCATFLLRRFLSVIVRRLCCDVFSLIFLSVFSRIPRDFSFIRHFACTIFVSVLWSIGQYNMEVSLIQYGSIIIIQYGIIDNKASFNTIWQYGN
jgi:hypothetical protein